MQALKGDWVRIYNIVQEAKDRLESLPEDTRQVPLEMWDKGFLINARGEIGDQVQVATIIGRKISGKLVEINPTYQVNYGDGVSETLYIGRQLREMLGDGYE